MRCAYSPWGSAIVSCADVLRRSLQVLLLALWPATAFANGAFPDATQVLLPAAHPDTIVVGTNFGLLISQDTGKSWRWTCEHDDGVNGYLYQVVPGSRLRLMALADAGIVASDDLACTWQAGQPPDPFVYDAFPDPGTPDRVLMLVARVEDKQQLALIVESVDGGRTQRRILYTAPQGMQLTTLEIARSDPRVVYATLYQLDGHGTTRVARSLDGGETWTLLETGGSTAPDQLWIAAVDPLDAHTVYFRVVTGDPTEKLAISHDGAVSVTIPLVTTGALSSFVRLDDGTLIVGALRMNEGHIYRAKDGQTFAELPASIRPRGMAGRGGQLYAATDNTLDGYALAVSSDQGDSWKRVMSFKDLSHISACGNLPTACVNSCAVLLNQGLVNASLCQGPPAPTSPAGGGSGCAYRPRPSGLAGPLLIATLAALAGLRRRRRR
jgi:hypothetical protein